MTGSSFLSGKGRAAAMIETANFTTRGKLLKMIQRKNQIAIRLEAGERLITTNMYLQCKSKLLIGIIYLTRCYFTV